MTDVLAYLNKNRMLYIPVIEPLERGNAEVVAFDADGAVIKQDGCLINFCLTSDQPLFDKYADLVQNYLCCIYDVRDISNIEKHYPQARRTPCRQLVYTKTEPPVFKTDAQFKLLDKSWTQFIFETYSNPHKSLERVAAVVEKNFMYGIFVDGQIAGFCGRHADGAMGLLEILPKFRRRGLGRIMEQFIIGVVLSEGRTPYGHVVFGNEISMDLQRSMSDLLIIPETVMFHSIPKKN